MERLTYKHDGKWCFRGINGKLASDVYGNYYGEAVDRLAEYEDAEAEGRLVVLPCRIGDTVFCIPAMGKEIIEDIVEDADIWSIKDGIKVRLTLKTFKDYVVGEFGKTVFLTKEEAEQALKGESE